MKNGQHREIPSIRYTRHRTKSNKTKTKYTHHYTRTNTNNKQLGGGGVKMNITSLYAEIVMDINARNYESENT